MVNRKFKKFVCLIISLVVDSVKKIQDLFFLLLKKASDTICFICTQSRIFDKTKIICILIFRNSFLMFFFQTRRRFVHYIATVVHEYQDTPLHAAVQAYDENEVLHLLYQGYQPHRRNLDKVTPLDLAFGSRREMMLIVMHYFQSVNYTWSEDMYQAYLQVRRTLEEYNLTQYLFEMICYFANIDLRKYADYTALQIVVCLLPMKKDLVKNLLDLGCDPFVVDKDGNNILHLLATARDLTPSLMCSRVRALLFIERGVEVNAQNKDKNTPLHITIQKHTKLETVFLRNDADIYIKNNEGKTPLDEALSQDDNYYITLMVKYTILAEHRGQPIPHQIMTMFQRDPRLTVRYDHFEQEIRLLKQMKISPDSEITYYDLLTKPRDEVFKVIRTNVMLHAYNYRTGTCLAFENDVFHVIREATRLNRVEEMSLLLLCAMVGDRLSYYGILAISRNFKGTDSFFLENALKLLGIEIPS